MKPDTASLSFAELKLKPDTLANLDSLGYTQMTPIQAKSLPIILQGEDIIAKAKTGSGKTAAFGLGLLESVDAKQFFTQSLVLCPTRELAEQVAKEIRRLGRAIPNLKVLTLCGGVSKRPQTASLEQHSPHIVVGTPGRILDHLQKNTLKLGRIKQLVLDEADRMLEMGFAEDIKRVLKVCNRQRQTLLFSATYPDTIREMSAHCQKNPQSISVDTLHTDENIEQHFYELDENVPKNKAVFQLLAKFNPESTIVFCNTKAQCQQVYELCSAQGLNVLALHGDLEQRDRDRALIRFANKSCPLLVATDVAARGLDVKNVAAVINLELAHDSEVHIHRIGRTGRAGERGLALSLIGPRERGRFNRLAESLGETLTLEALPDTDNRVSIESEMVTLNIDASKKDKVRPGDILGALTKDAGLPGDRIGKIDITNFSCYVAVHHSIAAQALSHIQNGKIKNRKFRVRKL